MWALLALAAALPAAAALRANASALAAFAPRGPALAAAALAASSRTAPPWQAPRGDSVAPRPASVVGPEWESRPLRLPPPPPAAAEERVPCKFGAECYCHDCRREHPTLPPLVPREANAQVVVLRHDGAGEFSVLLKRRAARMPGGGLLEPLGGGKRFFDLDSRDTAITDLCQESGLLDAGLLEGAPPHLSERARASSARPPLDFRLFHQSKRSDWYVLILDGHGTFASGVQGHLVEDGQPMLQELHEGRAAPTPGHAWLRLRAAVKLHPELTTVALARRLRQAAFAALHTPPHPSPRRWLEGRWRQMGVPWW